MRRTENTLFNSSIMQETHLYSSCTHTREIDGPNPGPCGALVDDRRGGCGEVAMQGGGGEPGHGGGQGVENHDGRVHRSVVMDVEKAEQRQQQHPRYGHCGER